MAFLVNIIISVTLCYMLFLLQFPLLYWWVPLKLDFWEHENQSGLFVIWLIHIKLYMKKENKLAKNLG